MPFKCEHCAATFITAGSLKAHISAVHLGLKPFECEQLRGILFHARTYAKASRRARSL